MFHTGIQSYLCTTTKELETTGQLCTNINDDLSSFGMGLPEAGEAAWSRHSWRILLKHDANNNNDYICKAP